MIGREVQGPPASGSTASRSAAPLSVGPDQCVPTSGPERPTLIIDVRACYAVTPSIKSAHAD